MLLDLSMGRARRCHLQRHPLSAVIVPSSPMTNGWSKRCRFDVVLTKKRHRIDIVSNSLFSLGSKGPTPSPTHKPVRAIESLREIARKIGIDFSWWLASPRCLPYYIVSLHRPEGGQPSRRGAPHLRSARPEVLTQ
jgi:hypothetical protein